MQKVQRNATHISVLSGAPDTRSVLNAFSLLVPQSSAAQLSPKNFSFSQPSPECFDESWRQTLSSLLGYARTAGADFCEVFLERRNYLSLLVENGKVTSISPQLVSGAGVRLFKGSDDCYVSTNDLSPKGLFWALDKALTILGFAKPSGSRIHVDVVLEPLRDYASVQRKGDWLRLCPSLQDSAAILVDINTTLKRTAHKAESVVTSNFRDYQEIMVAASDGIFASDIRLNQSFVSQLSCVDAAHRASLAERQGSSGNPLFLQEIEKSEIVEPLCESAHKMLYANYVQSGNYPVVMANKFGGVIFHEACGHLLETTQIEKKTTPFLEKKGGTIAHSSVTAWDESFHPHAFGSLSMDDEGMPTQSTLLIERGILRNFISDRTGCLRTGHLRTGSGRRQNYTFPAASRMRNTFIAGGEHTPDQLIATIEKGLYCKRMGGGSVGSTGEFNFAVTEGYLVENGKLKEPVKGATLIGQAKDILMNISMCANDTELSAGFCGSVSGTVYVTVGQPHIKVDAITVGGR